MSYSVTVQRRAQKQIARFPTDRAIYEINDEERVVTVLQVGHRRNIYR